MIAEIPQPDCPPGEEFGPMQENPPYYVCGPADLPDPTVNDHPAPAPAPVTSTTSTVQDVAPAVEHPAAGPGDPILKVGLFVAIVSTVVWKHLGKRFT